MPLGFFLKKQDHLDKLSFKQAIVKRLKEAGTTICELKRNPNEVDS